MAQIVSLPTSVLLELVLFIFLFCCFVVFMVVRFPEGGARLSAFAERLLFLREMMTAKRNKRSLGLHIQPQHKKIRGKGVSRGE